MAIPENITCPHCKKSFELSDAISHDLDARVQQQLQQELKKNENIFKQKINSLEAERL